MTEKDEEANSKIITNMSSLLGTAFTQVNS